MTHDTDYLRENTLLNEAICYAVACHAGQLRKGTHIPYILHPLEAMEILWRMKADNDLLIAGVLHDVVEDTDATIEDVAARFGQDVAALVAAHTQEKDGAWEERRAQAIQEAARADHRTKMLILADKVSNLRSIASDYRDLGDDLWTRFNAPKEKQFWYYSGIREALREIQQDPDAAPVYQEMTKLYEDVFLQGEFVSA